MKYNLIYAQLIARAKERGCIDGYVERHHILPRCLGGSDDSSNLVALTAREHFVAHLLLAKMYGGVLWHAVALMKKDGRGSSRSYEIAKKEISLMMKGNQKTLGFKHSQETKDLMSLNRKGKPGRKQSEQSKELLRIANVGKALPVEVREKISVAQKGKAKPEGFGAKVSAGLKGKPRSQEVKDKLSAHYAALRLAKQAIQEANSSTLHPMEGSYEFN
ncbi:MAG: HNH endonuclease [Terrimicrobiaceae bacterium]